MGDVLMTLADEGYLTDDDINRAAEQLAAEKQDTAWYIQGVMGCGGWMAAGFLFISAVWLLEPFLDIPMLAFIMGLLIAGVTSVIRRVVDNLAINQFMLVYHIVAQVIVLFALLGWGISDNAWPAYVLSIVIQAVAIALYPDAIVRFIGVLTITATLQILSNELNSPFIASVTSIALAGLVTVLWGRSIPPSIKLRYWRILRPVSYGAVVGLFGALIWELFADDSIYQASESWPTAPVLTSTAIALMVLYVVWGILQTYDVPATSVMGGSALAFVILLALPSLLAPGIMAALLVLLLGHQYGDRIMMTLGVLTIYGFIGQFYYSLATSLLLKSIIMMASGVVLLIGWALLRRQVPLPTETPAPTKKKGAA